MPADDAQATGLLPATPNAPAAPAPGGAADPWPDAEPVADWRAFDDAGGEAGAREVYALLAGVEPREGEALLVCSLGHFAVRGRPLAVALPLRAVQRVAAGQPAAAPAAAWPLAGTTLLDERMVPVYDAAALLGRRAADCTGGRLLFIASPGGAVALRVADLLGIDRPAHWAPAALLGPLARPELRGVIPRRERWTAIAGGPTCS
jgi:hypothetical protein